MATAGEQLIERGRREGECRALLKLLRARFGPVPEAVVTRVNAADVPQLDEWVDRVATATTLAEVLGEV